MLNGRARGSSESGSQALKNEQGMNASALNLHRFVLDSGVGSRLVPSRAVTSKIAYSVRQVLNL
ncbi:MAG: hypothetical protein GYB49_01140 [Alphaproteobacteria bacterium]|nr:hypothetical protein [Hyphomonas sp.]MBR9805819.1 hypothetical protein [Alphaproteobacteria bacterium]|tara:strand:+ start:8435 stop:8626 length:192 start_codon:yes stop_codon:yes gene_type:complete